MPQLSKKAICNKEYEAVLASRVVKAYVCFCIDNEDFEDEIDDSMVAELAVLKSSRYLFQGSYRQSDGNWESMLYDGKYLTDYKVLSHKTGWWKMIKSLEVFLESWARDHQCFISWCCWSS